MVDFKATSLVVLLVMLTVNVGLLAIDQADTGIRFFGSGPDDENGFGVDLLGASFLEDVKSINPTDNDGNPCPSMMPCKIYVNPWAGGWDALTGFIETIVTGVIVIFKYIGVIFVGFPLIMSSLANLISPSPAIHLLFSLFSIIVTGIALYGLWAFFKDVMEMKRI